MNSLVALWIATWKCSLVCPYCINYLSGITREQSAGLPEPVDCERWVETWNRYSPRILMISGGEPFLIPNMVDVIEGIHSTIYVNTNLTQDMSEFLGRIAPRHNLTLIASYHPTQQHDMFFNNAETIRKRGHRITVTFITYPRQLHLHNQIRAECRARGLRLKTETCLDLTNPLPYTIEQARTAKALSPSCRHHYINEVPTDRVIMCSGGHNYICVAPNGDTFPCTSKATCVSQTDTLGNILEERNVVSNAPMHKCTYGRCCSSDEDNITREILT